MNKKIYYCLAGILVLVFIIVLTTREKTINYNPLVHEDNAVVLADQQPDDSDTITVSYAKLSKPGYIVVKITDPVTNTTTILGTSELLPAGEHFDVKVQRRLHRSSGHQSESVTATLVADNGDGVFGEDDATLSVNEGGDEVADSKAVIDESIETSPQDITIEDITNALEEDGYNVDPDADALDDEEQETIDDEDIEEENDLDDDAEAEDTTASDETPEEENIGGDTSES